MFNVVRFVNDKDLIATTFLKNGGFCLTFVGVLGQIRNKENGKWLSITGLASMGLGIMLDETLTRTYIVYKQDQIEALNDLEYNLNKHDFTKKKGVK